MIYTLGIICYICTFVMWSVKMFFLVNNLHASETTTCCDAFTPFLKWLFSWSVKQKEGALATSARNRETRSNRCLISCSALRWLAVMHVMLIITLVITGVDLFNISCVNISCRKTAVCRFAWEISPPLLWRHPVPPSLCFFLSVKKQCLTPRITLDLALIHPTGSCVFCHCRDHSLISNGG